MEVRVPDDISVVGSISNSVVSGNLGNDTMDFTTVAKSSTIYGGGGFLYDTSLDGADSIELGSVTASLLHGNGGNDSFYLAGADIKSSTVYGGQVLISSVRLVPALLPRLGSLVTVVLTSLVVSAATVINSTILGSDTTGTIAGNDSLSLAATTLQTSTVYGGAGNDTMLLGGATNHAAGIIEVDVKAFAGADSIKLLVHLSPTVDSGAGDDTLWINTNTATASASTATAFYAGTGADIAADALSEHFC